MLKKYNTRFGFTLLEMVVVVGIIAVLIASIMPGITQDILRRREADNNYRMDAIEAAMMRFIAVNNRLPCPAQRNVAISTTTFGTEAATPGTCTNVSVGAVVGVYTSGTNIRMGAVPVRALGIPDEMAFDAWGRQFNYVVDLRLTSTSAFIVNPVDYTNSFTTTAGAARSATSIVVNDASGGARTPVPVMLIISHGPNGHGGFMRPGGVTRFNAGSTNTAELQNCNCTAALTDLASATFVAQLPTTNAGRLLNSFDDRVRTYTRAQLATPLEVSN